MKRVITPDGYAVIDDDVVYSSWVREYHRLDIDVWVASLQKYVAPSAVVVDVGAHIGAHTIVYSRLAPQGTVYAFEPQPVAFSCLQHNLSQCTNVQLRQLALSNKSGVLRMRLHDADYRASRIETEEERTELPEQRAVEDKAVSTAIVAWLKNDQTTILVQTSTLDEQFPEQQVNFIKIDVEGHEAPVLQGGLALLKRCRPVLQLELSPFLQRMANRVPSDLIKFIQEQGYQVRRINGAALPDDVDTQPLGWAEELLALPEGGSA